MNFFYSAGAMRYGEGYWFHRFYNFPKLKFVTKTLTFNPKRGCPWAIMPIGNSVYNKIGLHNIGISNWLLKYFHNNATVSIAGNDFEIEEMVRVLDGYDIDGIELNVSCPNVKLYENRIIPNSRHKLYLKLNYQQNPYNYDLDRISGIRLNSIPLGFCGGSGKTAQKKNWSFIERYNKENLNVAGCSFLNFKDIKCLEDFGCREIGIGSTILTNPRLIEKIKNYME